MRSEIRLMVEREPADVWAYLDEPQNELEWQPVALERVRLTEGPLTPGSRIRQVNRFMAMRLESEWEVVAHGEFHRTDRTETGGARIDVTRRVEPTGTGSALVIIEVEADAGSSAPLGRLLETSAIRFARRDMKNAAQMLKKVLEDGRDQGSAAAID